MWKFGDLKHKSRHMLKRNYLAMIAVCFILSQFAVQFGSSLQITREYDFAVDHTKQVESLMESRDMSSTVVDIFNHINKAEIDIHDETHPVNGVFAGLFNAFSRTQTTLNNVIRTIGHVIGGSADQAIVVGIISILLAALYAVFVKSPFIVGADRFFLENNLYEKTRISRMFAAFRRETFLNVVWIMFLKNLFTFLWSFTIVGGFIKHYSYKMIPYILAENPEIEWKEAFQLSESMMKGNKWRTFLLDMSFILWRILSILTFGMLGIFFLNPYYKGTEAELYLTLRRIHIQNEGVDYHYFTDRYLTELPEESKGYWYPGYEHLTKSPVFNPDRHYILINLVLLFFIASIIGWCWEVSLYLIQDGVFVNRGSLHGPWLPIYGCGAVGSLILLRRFTKKPFLLFFMTMLVCGIVEYTTSWYLQTFRGIAYWNYHGCFLNINGRICAASMLTFATAGCAFIYYIAPRLDHWLNKIPLSIRYTVAGVLSALFITDCVYSSKHPNEGKDISSPDPEPAKHSSSS